MKKQITTALLIAVVTVVASCSKKDKDVKPPVQGKPDKGAFSNCRITAMAREGFNHTDRFAYNAQGELTDWFGHNSHHTYSVSKNRVVINYYRDTVHVRKITADLNGVGLATRVETEQFGLYPRKDYIDYKYDDKNQLYLTSYTYSGAVSPTHYNHQWLDGNLVATSDAKGNLLISYTYTSDPIQPADLLNLTNLIQGYSTVRNKNLISTMKTGEKQDVFKFSYVKDEKGLIKSISMDGPGTGPDPRDIYSYECDK
jgi:hypothetical protein